MRYFLLIDSVEKGIRFKAVTFEHFVEGIFNVRRGKFLSVMKLHPVLQGKG